MQITGVQGWRKPWADKGLDRLLKTFVSYWGEGNGVPVTETSHFLLFGNRNDGGGFGAGGDSQKGA